MTICNNPDRFHVVSTMSEIINNKSKMLQVFFSPMHTYLYKIVYKCMILHFNRLVYCIFKIAPFY